MCGFIYAIYNNYSKDPIIKTSKDLKSLFYFEAFLADAALLSWPYWARSKFAQRLHNLH
jgi:hypothetical protein